MQADDTIQSLYAELGKKKNKLDDAIDILVKLLKNISDNPTEEKYRSFKKDNTVIKEKLTKYKSGVKLIQFIGFQEVIDP